MKVGIIYASDSKMLRSFIVPDNPDVITVRPTNWETLLVADVPDIEIETLSAAIKDATGVDPPSSRCCVIVDNVVVKMIAADPAIDHIPGATLWLSAVAEVGWRWNPSTLTLSS